MKRRYAVLLAALWVAALVSADVWCILEFKVADAHLKRALGEMFEAPVSFGDLAISAGGDIVATDVRLMRPDRLDKLYGTIDEVRVTPRWIDLLTRFQLEVKEIAVQNPTLVVQWHDRDGTFDMPSPLRSDLEARTRTMGELPAIALKGLTLVLENPPEILKKQQAFDFEQLSITLAPEGSARWLYRFEVDVDHPILGRMVGTGRFSRDAFVAELQRKGLMVTPALLRVVRPEIRELLEKFSVDGDLTLTATVGPVAGGSAEVFSAAIDCAGMCVRFRDWPQALSAIHGRVDYSHGRLASEGLRAQFENAPINVAGFLDLGDAGAAVRLGGSIIGLRITNDLAARIRMLPDPCPTVADQIEAWDPDGFANILFRLEQDRDGAGNPGLLRPSFDVEFKGGATLRYVGHVGDDGRRHGFAYPLEDLRGVLKFTDKVATFERLTAMNGSLAVEARGRIDYEHAGDETYDVDVNAHGLKLDDRVSAALTGASRELFNSLDAQGSADLTVAVKREKGEPPGPRVDVAVDLQGVALRPRPFPLDFADTRGRVVIPDSGPIRIEKVTARRGGGSLALSGSVPVGVGQSELDIKVDFEKFPVDPALTSALSELVADAAETLEALNPSGRVDGNLHVATGREGSITDMSGSIAFEDMALAPEDPSLRIEDLDGTVTLAPSTITINRGTTAAIAGERFAVNGTIEGGSKLDLTVEAENFQIDRELLADVEPLIPWIRRFEQKPELEGPMSIRLHVAGTHPDLEIGVDLEFLGVDVSLGAVPGLHLTDLRGRFSLAPDGKATLRDVATRIPVKSGPADSRPSDLVAGVIEKQRPAIAVEVVSGTWTPAPDGSRKSGQGRLALGPASIRGAEVSPELIALLPVSPDLKQRLETLALAATIDLVVGKLSWEDGQLSASRSQLTASRLSLGLERAIRAEAFTIDRMSLTAGGGLLDLGGDFTFRGARFLDIPIPMMIGKIGADRQGVRLESIEADLFGYEERDGRRFSLGKINPETSRLEIRVEDGFFDTRLRFQEVNLPAALRAFGGDPGKVSGTFSSGLMLAGTMGDAATYKGKGNLAVRARNVVSLPMFYRMFNSLDVLSVFEKSDPWTKVEVNFDVGNGTIDMQPLRIDSPDVLLQGRGTLTFAGMINADLKTNHGMGISPIGWVTRLISKVVFSGVKIDGPIGDPRVNAYSLAGG